MADTGFFLQPIITVTFTAISILLGAFIYVKRDSFRTGRLEATVAGKTELNSTLLSNAINEIEKLKQEIEKLSESLGNQTVSGVRLEERLKYINERLDALAADVKTMMNAQTRHYKRRS